MVCPHLENWHTCHPWKKIDINNDAAHEGKINYISHINNIFAVKQTPRSGAISHISQFVWSCYWNISDKHKKCNAFTKFMDSMNAILP